MARLGLKGIAMMAACALGAAIMMRWGSGWATFAKVLVCCLMGMMGVFGLILIGTASFGKENRCETPGCRNTRGIRFCDYKMVNNHPCARHSCQDHTHVIGDRDLCPSHYDEEL